MPKDASLTRHSHDTPTDQAPGTARIKWDRIFVKLDTNKGSTLEDLPAFNQLDFKGKLGFVDCERLGILPADLEGPDVAPNTTFIQARDWVPDGKQFYHNCRKYFNPVNWLNNAP